MNDRRFTHSFHNAIDGLIHAFKTERNLKIHSGITVMVLTLCMFLDLTSVEVLLVLFAISLVLVSELINTAVETLVNLLTLEHHPLARIVKDVAAGAVLIACANATAVGYLVMLPALQRPMLMNVLGNIRSHQVLGAVIVVTLLLIVIMLAKALRGRTSLTGGGLVSGHAVLAFAASTAILLVSKNLLATVLAFALAVLVAQSRIEANFHRWIEVSAGALIGIVSSLLLFEVLYTLRTP